MATLRWLGLPGHADPLRRRIENDGVEVALVAAGLHGGGHGLGEINRIELEGVVVNRPKEKRLARFGQVSDFVLSS